MPHLICVAHQKRVFVLDHVVVHRDDGQHCYSEYLAHARHGRTTPALVRIAAQQKEKAGASP